MEEGAIGKWSNAMYMHCRKSDQETESRANYTRDLGNIVFLCAGRDIEFVMKDSLKYENMQSLPLPAVSHAHFEVRQLPARTSGD